MTDKSRIKYSSITGFLLVCIFGSINHFIYQLSGNNPVVGAFVPVNESVWEHLKLLFFPFVAYMLCEFFTYGHKIRGFLFSRVVGLLCGLIFIPVVFYTYTGIIGRSFFLLDILTFITASALSFYVGTKRILNSSDGGGKTIPALILIVCLTVLFVGFTFYPPDSPLFKA
ncbi:MAG: hypothetical protein IJ861_04775 [Clostridia bacterium]|nr:hypothetical protein [Clostridia bacterium]